MQREYAHRSATHPSHSKKSSASGDSTTGEPGAIPWKKFSGRISYSSCNEDSRSELKALHIAPGKRVFCITAGEDACSTCYTIARRRVVAVDVNPTQNHLLELKIAAMRALDYEPYLAFLGVRPARESAQGLQELAARAVPRRRSLLRCSPADRAARGALPRQPRALSRARGSRFPRGAADLAQPAVQVRRHRETAPLPRRMEHARLALCRRDAVPPLLPRAVLERSRLLALRAPEVPLHRRIFDLMHEYLRNHLARDSHLLQLIFFARYIYEPAMPIYLLPGSYERIREALKTTKITIVTAPAAAALADISGRHLRCLLDRGRVLVPERGRFRHVHGRDHANRSRRCATVFPRHLRAQAASARARSSCAPRSQPGTQARLRRSGDGARIRRGQLQ